MTKCENSCLNESEGVPLKRYAIIFLSHFNVTGGSASTPALLHTQTFPKPGELFRFSEMSLFLNHEVKTWT